VGSSAGFFNGCLARGWNGADRDRTDNPCLAKAVLSQLSYGPVVGQV
jgi:hypothetical protein